MAFFDLPLDQLQTYHPPRTSQPDFRQFWLETLAEVAQQPLQEAFEPLTIPYNHVQAYRATYRGWNNAEVVGTYACPEGSGPFPAVAMYHGYSSLRPNLFELLGWILHGYAIFAIDIRGQPGESSDNSGYLGGHVPGYLTQGIHDPHDHYYRGAYIDALRAVDVLATRPEVDAKRIVATGASQGGGITLAVAALSAMRHSNGMPNAGEIQAAVAEIPFLCHFDRAATLIDNYPYREIAEYCRRRGEDGKAVLRTLSYFDGMNMAEYIAVPTLITAGLMDMVCPPSTVFAVYNAIQARKDIIVAPFGEHETFPGVLERRMQWFDEVV